MPNVDILLLFEDQDQVPTKQIQQQKNKCETLYSLVKVAGYLACNETFMLSIILIDVQCLVEYSLSFPPYTRYLLSYLDAIRYRMEIWALENITFVNIYTHITMFLYSLVIAAQLSNYFCGISTLCCL